MGCSFFFNLCHSELERIKKERERKSETEKDLKKQIEDQKRKKQKLKDDDEPWWMKQDRKKAELAKNQIPQTRPSMPKPTTESTSSTHAIHPLKSDRQNQFEPVTKPAEIMPLELGGLKSNRSPSPPKRLIMREIQTQERKKIIIIFFDYYY